MNKAKINVQMSGIKNSLVHMEVTKPGHAGTLFVTWCKVSDDDDRWHYGWQFMRDNIIECGDTSARTVTHEELGRDVENLIQDIFLEDTTKHVDQADYGLLVE